MKCFFLIFCHFIYFSVVQGQQIKQSVEKISPLPEYRNVSPHSDPKTELHLINSELKMFLNPFGDLQREKIDTVFKPVRITIGDAVRQTISYNQAGKIQAKRTEYLSDGTWNILLREDNLYDSRNNLILSKKDTCVSGNWVNKSIDSLFYDDMGRLKYGISNTYYTDGTLKSKIRNTAEFNEQDLMIKYITEKWNNNSWKKSKRLSYSYDKYKYVSEYAEEEPNYSSDDWRTIMRMKYTHDSYGRLTYIYKESEWAEVLLPQYSRSYEYDSKGNIIYSNLMGKSPSYIGLIYVSSWDYTYDSLNNNIKTVEKGLSDFLETIAKYEMRAVFSGKRQLSTELWQYREISRSWSLVVTTTTTYNDSAGLKIWNKFYGTANTQRDSILYDEMERPLTIIHCEKFSSLQGLSIYSRNDYSYDNHDNISSVRYFRFNESTGSWTPANNFLTIYYNNKKDSLTFFTSSVEVDYSPLTDVKEELITGEKQFCLYQNYPNPFNPSTTIKYSIKKEGSVRLAVYDILGREAAVLVNETKPAGTYTVKFDGSGLSSGIYLYRLESGGYTEIKKLMLIK